ncbi:MAG: hypothetical protein HKN68_18040 [Saprospiraceae bacterium]|nr:hypothetical protein [Saprospiraceae bacterium]
MPWSRCSLLLLLLILFSFGCSTPKGIPEGWKKYDMEGLSFYAPGGFTSNKDLMLFYKGADTIRVVAGKNNNLPLSLEESFMNAFNAYHYNKFFDKVMMDPKVKKIFRDSVQLVDIFPTEGKNVTGCSNCNVLAKIKFKKKVFDFPVQMSETELNDHHCYMLLDQSNEKYKKLIYIASNHCGYSKTYVESKKSAYTIIFTGLYADDLAIAQTVKL